MVRFHYMALSDDKQRIMPTQQDRENSRPLAYPEAVLLTNTTNPKVRGEVDDKYQYSSEVRDDKVHGWISPDPPVGFWIITPSEEFRSAGPTKQELTSHVGPTALSVSPPLHTHHHHHHSSHTSYHHATSTQSYPFTFIQRKFCHVPLTILYQKN
jgi:rhamnogalacturonan endolyase